MPKGIPLTEEEQAIRRREIFHSAVGIFLKKGFQETSMREIAETAGLGKSTLYDYFKTKEDLLIYFFEDQWSELASKAWQIAMQNSSPDLRLRQMMETYLDSLEVNKGLFLKLALESQRLKPENQKRIQQKRHAYQNLIGAVIEEGIREGLFRKINSLLAARLLLGSISPVIFGSRVTAPVREMLNETMDIFFNGILVG